MLEIRDMSTTYHATMANKAHNPIIPSQRFSVNENNTKLIVTKKVSSNFTTPDRTCPR